MKPSKFRVVTDAPDGKNHDPSVHSDINAAHLSVFEFMVLACSAYCARRRGANITTSHLTIAKACRMSVSEVRRAREALAGPKGFLVLTGNARGTTNTYVLTEKMQWGASGCKLWLPSEVWALGLNPYELRQYCYYVSQTRGTGRVVINRSEINRQCGISEPKQRATDAGLIAAGLIALVGYEDKRPVLKLRPNSEWVRLEDRQSLTYAEAKRNVRTGLESAQKETPEQGVTAKRNVRTGKKKRENTKSNPVIKEPFNREKDFEVGKQKPETAATLFEELLGKNAIAGFQHYLKRQTPNPTAEMDEWFKQFGSQTIRQAWTIIQRTETSADSQPYGKNIRLINFCRGQLHGINDPHELCELHTQATVKLPPIFKAAASTERCEAPPIDPSALFVPRSQRARAQREAA